jgi:hypothetical protein
MDKLIAMGIDCSNLAELPTNVKEALLRLASDERIRELEVMLQDQIKLVAGVDEDEVAEPSEEVTIPGIDDWEEGTEDLRVKSMDQLWTMIGLGDTKSIPGLNAKIDIDGTHNPWHKQDQEWFEKNGVDFVLGHYQLVGIVRLLEMFFKDGMHSLLGDEVGLGKTVQMIGLTCLIRYFREYHNAHKRFPGDFGTCVY